MKHILFLLLFSSVVALGQNDRGTTNITEGFGISRASTKGHPFLLNKWVLGYGVQADSSLTQPQLLNYDIYGNNFTFKTGEGPEDIMVITDQSYTGFILKAEGDKDMAFLKIAGSQFEKDKRENKFYLLAKPHSKLVIIEPIKELDDPNQSGWAAASTNTKSAEYKYKERIYVLDGEGKYTQVNLKKSSVIKALKDKKKQLDNYFSSNNISLEQPEDLVRVIEYYHSL